MATKRPSLESRARYTSPIPPAPSGETISYGPNRVPAESPKPRSSEELLNCSSVCMTTAAIVVASAQTQFLIGSRAIRKEPDYFRLADDPLRKRAQFPRACFI